MLELVLKHKVALLGVLIALLGIILTFILIKSQAPKVPTRGVFVMEWRVKS